MTEQMQRDIELVSEAMIGGRWPRLEERNAWQRLKASLSPNREVVARALVLRETVLDECAMSRDTMDYWREMADAAIKAMQGVSK